MHRRSAAGTSPASSRSVDRPRSSAIRPGRGRQRRRFGHAVGSVIGETFWTTVREQFVMPPELAVMNAANLCPAPRPVVETLRRETDQRRPRSVADEPRAAHAREGGDAQGAGRVPARDAGRDHHHAQHQRVEQSRLERARSQGRRRGDRSLGQPPQQPDGVAGEGQAIRVLGRDRRAEEPASRHGLLRRRLHARDHPADEGAVLHASVEHGRRPLPGRRAVRAARVSAAC